MTKLSYLHFNARSRKITRADILEVFAEETSVAENHYESRLQENGGE